VGNFHAWSASETVEGGETAMNFQQLGAAGSPAGHARPALSQAAPLAEPGQPGTSPPRAGFPSWSLSRRGCRHPQTRGEAATLLPLNLQLCPWQGPSPPATTPQGLGLGSTCCHCPPAPSPSSLRPSPPRTLPSLCPEVLGGFIPPKSPACLTGVSPAFS